MWNRKTRIDTGAKEKRRPGVRRRERGENLLKRERGGGVVTEKREDVEQCRRRRRE